MYRFVKATPLVLTVVLLVIISTGVSAPTATTHADAAGDRDALVALYNATGGANWTNSDNWLSDEPLSQWEGVVADGNGRVTRLWLNGNQLSGPIPPELGNLSNLEWLNLYDNQLSGPIPPELGSLSNLEELLLYNNQLSGEIPAALGSLSNLERLTLRNNQLSGEIPPGLGSLSNLVYLFLGGNRLSGEIPPELGSLTNLRYLYLYDNQLTGPIPSELGDLTKLDSLYLYDNRLSGEIPPELGSLSILRFLRLNGNQLSEEIPPELGSLSNLYRLYLSNNQLTGCVPAGLREVTDNDLDGLGLDFCEAEVPGAPTGLTAAASETGARVDLSWTASTFTGGVPITGYAVESSPDGTDPWVGVFTTTGAATSYTDDGTDANGPMFRRWRVAPLPGGGGQPGGHRTFLRTQASRWGSPGCPVRRQRQQHDRQG